MPTLIAITKSKNRMLVGMISLALSHISATSKESKMVIIREEKNAKIFLKLLQTPDNNIALHLSTLIYNLITVPSHMESFERYDIFKVLM